MNYTMDASYRTRAVRTLLKAYDVKNAANPDQAFLKKMQQIAGAASETTDAAVISTAEMTMEEYKEYLYDRISQLPVHPSNMQDYVSIQISEEGLEKMKTDIKYIFRGQFDWLLSAAFLQKIMQ